jgi:hypothetical protein
MSEIERALDTPWKSKHDDCQLYYFTDDMRSKMDDVHGFTDTEDEEEDEEEAEDEEDKEEAEDEEDKEEGDEDAWHPYHPAAKKQRV